MQQKNLKKETKFLRELITPKVYYTMQITDGNGNIVGMMGASTEQQGRFWIILGAALLCAK